MTRLVANAAGERKKMFNMTKLAKNTLVFNTTAMKHASLAMEIEAAKSAGYAGIETTYAKLHDYLEVFSLDDLRTALSGMSIYGVGTVINIERHGGDLESLKADAHRVFDLGSGCIDFCCAA